MSRKFLEILSYLAVFSLFIIILNSCNDEKQVQRTTLLDNKQIKDSIENINRRWVAEERVAIKAYIEQSGNEFVETGTGLCYYIVNQGDSVLIKTGNIVALEYKLSLLDGAMLYSSDENGPRVFVVGHGGVESGLEEAVLHLHNGDEAEIIIPSRLAHGLTGDGNRIPPRSTIVYKVKVIGNQINR